ncbi:MAG: DUF4917 family protein [Xanthomonadales bacterium]|nr:DUF4917 family protein [Xanthomonadales bacterium]
MQTFSDIIERHGAEHVHAVLGNGFSQACRNDIFSYDALFDRADFSGLSEHCRAAFETLGSTDFEHVIKSLQQAAALLSLYKPEEQELATAFRTDADQLREVLVGAIAESHPDWPGDIDSDSFAACKRFLSHFERIYTLNYDLLLYWAFMQDEIDPQLSCDDGFRKPATGDEDYVSWEVENSYNQKIYYLHGALHLFDAGDELQKYTWVNTGKRLTEQVREALSEGKYPLFVSEGTSRDKLEKIKHSGYLHRGLASIGSVRGLMVAFGVSFSSNDEHILQLIERGKIDVLAVGLYGDPDSPDNRRIVERVSRMRDRRAQNHEGRRSPVTLEVDYFDAESAGVWG